MPREDEPGSPSTPQAAACPLARNADHTRVIPFTPTRWALAALGVASVGLGALGVFVPGLPTTVFLIIATWCFARSCPWLEAKLVRNRFFRPFLCYLEPGAVMPLKARIFSLIAMWTAIALSVFFIARSDAPLAIPAIVVLSGLIGTICILRVAKGNGSPAVSA